MHDISPEALFPIVGAPPEAFEAAGDGAPWQLALAEMLAVPRADVATATSFPESGLAPFLNLVSPFVESAHRRLRAHVQTTLHRCPDIPLCPDRFVKFAALALPDLLLPMIARTLVMELNARRLSGALAGEDPRARFSSFAGELSRPAGRAALLTEYPVLTRGVIESLANWSGAYSEFLTRLCMDWDELREAFGEGGELGTVANLAATGDLHRRGRSVLVVTFSSGLSCVYKPRSLACDQHFQELVTWLNQRGLDPPLPTMTVLDRDTHGWAEFIPFRGCTVESDVRTFYRRQGAYLAVLHTLEAVDFHLENLISRGAEPFLVDLETLFHPRLGGQNPSQDPARELLSESVLRVGLLPYRRFGDDSSDGVDLSGLGGNPGQKIPFAVPRWEEAGTDVMRLGDGQALTTGSQNRPHLDANSIDVVSYADELTAGFATTYRLLILHKHELLAANGPVQAFAQDETRVILRPTFEYATALRASWHPDFLRDALDRSAHFTCLWPRARQNRHLTRALPAELDDLQAGDIPVFATRPDSTDVRTSKNVRIAEFLSEPSLARVRRRVMTLDAEDLCRQVWLIRASLATLVPLQERREARAVDAASPGGGFEPDDLIAAACSIGRRLQALAIRDADCASWVSVGVGARRTWSLSPAGVGLYDGLAGIALFLGYLGTVSGDPAFDELAFSTLQTIRAHLRSPAQSDRWTVGAFDGLGGVVYLLAHLGQLWRDRSLLDEASGIASQMLELASSDHALDVISGSAGALMCMIALNRVAPAPWLTAAAISLGEHLLRHSEATPGGLAWMTHIPAWAPLTGFAHGASGIAWALLELYGLTGLVRYRDAALEAFRYESGCFSETAQNWPDFRRLGQPNPFVEAGTGRFGAAWCHGSAGITLARLMALRYVDTREIRRDIAAGLASTVATGFGVNHGLCHGDLGKLEVLIQASSELPAGGWSDVLRRSASRILASGIEGGWALGVPLDVDPPGLMTGIAGVGFGLLRVAQPERVPSVLLLEAPGSQSQFPSRRRPSGSV
jgi:type 2 lantibiotic biosynthesis protein LanM